MDRQLEGEERRLAARALFEREQRGISERLRVWAGSEAFREAVAWQNRQAVAIMLDGLRERPFGAIDHSTRRKESLVARYLQRYCTKNDTSASSARLAGARSTRAARLICAPVQGC